MVHILAIQGHGAKSLVGPSYFNMRLIQDGWKEVIFQTSTLVLNMLTKRISGFGQYNS